MRPLFDAGYIRDEIGARRPEHSELVAFDLRNRTESVWAYWKTEPFRRFRRRLLHRDPNADYLCPLAAIPAP